MVKDREGNRLKEELSYINGKTLELVLKPERSELSPGDHTFFEVFLLKDGKETFVNIEDIEIDARQGYFEGPKYIAPSNSGTDFITAKHKTKNAKGLAKIKVKRPRLYISWSGNNTYKFSKKISCKIEVFNRGNFSVFKNKLVLKLPENLDFMGADKKSEYFAPVREVHCEFGLIGAEVKKIFTFYFRPRKDGKYFIKTAVKSCGIDIKNKTFQFEVYGPFRVNLAPDQKVTPVGSVVNIKGAIIATEEIENLRISYKFPDQMLFQKGTSKLNGKKYNFSILSRKISFPKFEIFKKNDKLEFFLTLKVIRFGNLKNTLYLMFDGLNGKTRKKKYDLPLFTQ